jgi:sugar/nucleoside kinase (ribokinase family)
MFNLIAIGDPIVDTHIQIDEQCDSCQVLEAKQDQLCFKYGDKIPIIDSFQALGGNAPNVAVGMAKLGLSSALLSTVGSDAYGRLVLQELNKRGVDTSLVSKDPKHKTRYSIVLNYKKERTILSYSEEKNYRWPSTMPATDWIYYTGLSKGFETIQQELISYLKKHPTTRLALNPGSYILKYAIAKLREMLPLTDILIVNLEEGEKITSTTLTAEKNITSLLHKLLATGVKEIVLTDGPHGSWAGTHDGLWQMPPFPIEVISKTGAGDAFSSAYLAARLHSKSIAEALSWATANSTGVILAHGPHDGLLDEAGIHSTIQRFHNIKPIEL